MPITSFCRRLGHQPDRSLSQFGWIPPLAVVAVVCHDSMFLQTMESPPKSERVVFERTDAILALRGGRPPQVKEILISKTMRIGAASYAEAASVWEPAEGRIVIKRDQLASLARYAGTLLHEIAHAETGTPDISAGFEDALTGKLGEVAESSLSDSRG